MKARTSVPVLAPDEFVTKDVRRARRELRNFTGRPGIDDAAFCVVVDPEVFDAPLEAVAALARGHRDPPVGDRPIDLKALALVAAAQRPRQLAPATDRNPCPSCDVTLGLSVCVAPKGTKGDRTVDQRSLELVLRCELYNIFTHSLPMDSEPWNRAEGVRADLQREWKEHGVSQSLIHRDGTTTAVNQ